MTRIEEGNLAFNFGNRWRVFKLDEHRDYRARMEKLDGTKAVDFLGILDEQELFLIEVKDFRGYRIKNKNRQLSIELAQKVRDSLACIIGAYQTSSDQEHWQPYVRLLCNRQTRIRVALWLEDDPPPFHRRLRQKAKASVGGNVFKKKLTWLTSRVLLCGSDKEALPDVSISNLPHHPSTGSDFTKNPL